MIDVKLTIPAWPILRQTPGSRGIWGDCRFWCNCDIDRCDYWVVVEGLDQRKESSVCPQEHTILITCEPPAVKTYKAEFLRQFNVVITCHRAMDHPHPVFYQPGLPWHVGRRQNNHVDICFTKDYDELKAMGPFPKTKLLSIVCSSKQGSDGHRRRYAFALRLKQHFGDRIDLFGRGLNEIEDKWDALADYRYHVVVENSAVNDYWTEKLSDAFLAGCYPLYYGCPNIGRYFDAACMTRIDIRRPEEAIDSIEKCIRHRRYEADMCHIWEARDKVLDTHNLFPMIANYIYRDRQRSSGGCAARPVRITLRKEPSESNLIYKFKKKILRWRS